MGKKGPSSKSVDAQAWQWTENTNSSKITNNEIRKSYRLDLPKCSNCRKNCSGNPSCLKGLGESHWLSVPSSKDEEERLLKVEKDIEAERRKAGDLVGLQNLGATCYVNTYLQLWFHNVKFRNAIYSLKNQDDAASSKTLCGQLQLMFGLLQNSVSKSVDPTSFIQALGLATDLQQDAQEFSKLFMCLLETTPELSSIIQDQFCGEYVYLTQCQSCQYVTETPAKFYELDLNIQKQKDLRSCLLEFLKQEKLNGENQYFCDVCQSKQDAVRQIVLRKLPQTLSIQLLRFIYDRSTQRRQKLNTNLSFPNTLNFTTIVNAGETGNSGPGVSSDYYLSAVLIHRGPSASSGHYVAHILDSCSGTWHKFNDEVVVKMKGGKKLDLDNCKDEDDIWKDIQQEPPQKKPKLVKGNHSSKDVYMLVYSKMSPDDYGKNQVPVPKHIQQLVDQHNSEFETRLMDAYLTAEEEQREQHELSKNRIDFLKKLNSESDTFEWIPTSVLKSFLTPGKQIDSKDFSNLTCCHDNIKLDKVSSLKRIPKAAADLIYANCTEALHLPHSRMCYDCVKDRCLLLQFKRKLASDFLEVTETMKSFHNDPQSDFTSMFYVGRHTMKKWRSVALQKIVEKYQTKSSEVDSVGGTETTATSGNSDDENFFVFNSDLLCEHDNLTVDDADVQIVPKSVWDILLCYFPGNERFKVDESDRCPECMEDVERHKRETKFRKQTAQKQKLALSQLYSNRNRPSHVKLYESATDVKCISEKYFIVSLDFVSKWREFVRYPERMEQVTEVNNSVFLCPHLKLLRDLTLLSAMEQKDGEDCPVLLWPEEWKIIQENFDVDHVICITKIYTAPCTVLLEKIKNCKNPKLEQENNVHLNGDMQDEEGTKNPSVFIQPSTNSLKSSKAKYIANVECSPKVCLECVAGLAMEEQRKLHKYDYADIYVVKSAKTMQEMQHETFANEMNGLQNSASSGNVRRTSRARRCARGERKISNISSSLTLKELKVKIMGIFSVPPFDQNLWLNGSVLSDDEETLSNLSVVPGCTITLVEDLPNPTDTPIIFDSPKSTEPEVGFKGTSLLGYSS